MRKHRAYYIWHKVGGLSLALLTAVFAVSLLVSILALRQNNLTMIRLRNEVYVADKSGGDVEAALRELRTFVYAHMNTNLRAGSTSSEAPIQLTNTYNRIVAAEQARVASLGGNAAVYQAAKQSCVSKTDETENLQCVQQYFTDKGGGRFQLSLPAKEFYTFDFVSPFWSPDIAGFAVIISILSGLLLIMRLIAGRILKRYFDS